MPLSPNPASFLFCLACYLSHFHEFMKYHSVPTSWQDLLIQISPLSKCPPRFILVFFIYSFSNSLPKLLIYAFTEGLINILMSGVAVIDARVVVFQARLVVVGIGRHYRRLIGGPRGISQVPQKTPLFFGSPRSPVVDRLSHPSSARQFPKEKRTQNVTII